MRYLKALSPILFESKQYRTGDRLPAHANKLVQKWIKNKVAVWITEEQLLENTDLKEEYNEDHPIENNDNSKPKRRQVKL